MSPRGRRYRTYTVVYWLAGRRERKSFAKLANALAEAQRVAIQLANAQTDPLKLSNKDMAVYLEACETLKPLGVPLHHAVREFADAVRDLQPHGRTLPAAIREYSAALGKLAQTDQTGVTLQTLVDYYVARHVGGMNKTTVSQAVGFRKCRTAVKWWASRERRYRHTCAKQARHRPFRSPPFTKPAQLCASTGLASQKDFHSARSRGLSSENGSNSLASRILARPDRAFLSARSPGPIHSTCHPVKLQSRFASGADNLGLVEWSQLFPLGELTPTPVRRVLATLLRTASSSRLCFSNSATRHGSGPPKGPTGGGHGTDSPRDGTSEAASVAAS